MGKILSRSCCLKQLNYVWRIFATALGFSVFGMGGLFLTFFVFPIVLLCIRDLDKRHFYSQQIIKKSFQLYVFFLSCLGLLSYRFEHFEKLEEDFGSIIVANHPSLLDFVFLASKMPKCDCIVKQALEKNFFLKGVVKAAGYIPNSETEILLPHCQEKLKNSGMLLIFPEGTRTKINQPFTLKRGAANLALRTSSDIRLINIYCDQPNLSKELKWYQIPKQKPNYTITVHEKLSIKQFVTSETLSIEARKLTTYLQEQLTKNYAKAKQNGDQANEFKTRTKITNY